MPPPAKNPAVSKTPVGHTGRGHHLHAVAKNPAAILRWKVVGHTGDIYTEAEAKDVAHLSALDSQHVSSENWDRPPRGQHV